MASDTPKVPRDDRGQSVRPASRPTGRSDWTNRFARLNVGPVRQHVWTAGRLLLLAVALLVTYGVFFLAAMRVATHAREVKVPDLRGRSVAEATTALANVGLSLRVDPQRRSDSSVPADHVMSQDPGPGSVLRRQRAVRVHVSDGSRAPIVSSVVGQLERDAERTLAQDHIQVIGRAEIQAADYAPGTIIA